MQYLQNKAMNKHNVARTIASIFAFWGVVLINKCEILYKKYHYTLAVTRSFAWINSQRLVIVIVTLHTLKHKWNRDH